MSNNNQTIEIDPKKEVLIVTKSEVIEPEIKNETNIETNNPTQDSVQNVDLIGEPSNNLNEQILSSDADQPKLLILDFLNNQSAQKTLKGLGFWLKLAAIMMWIGAAFLFLGGLMGIIYIFGPLMYWPFAGINIWLGVIAWQAANQLESLQNCSNQDKFNTQVIVSLNKLKQYFQIQGWLAIVSIIFAVLLFLIFLIYMAYAFNTGFRMDDWQRFN
jgi:Family of unknown function (DUF5362)